MRKHQKIYYFGGMISLIFIPIIFWFSAQTTLNELNLRVLDIGLPYKVKAGEKVPNYAVIPIEGYKYETINLPNNFSEEIEINYVNKIMQLQKQNIDKTGIKFQFTDSNNYNDLVRLINLMLKTKQDIWGLDTENTNAFYVIHRKIEYNDDDDFVICGGVILDYIDKNEYDFKHANFLTKIIKYSPKEAYYLILGFLVLTYMSVNRLIKFNKKTLQIIAKFSLRAKHEQ